MRFNIKYQHGKTALRAIEYYKMWLDEGEKEYRSCIYKTLATTTWVGSAIDDVLV